jgi:hypothetical protein
MDEKDREGDPAEMMKHSRRNKIRKSSDGSRRHVRAQPVTQHMEEESDHAAGTTDETKDVLRRLLQPGNAYERHHLCLLRYVRTASRRRPFTKLSLIRIFAGPAMHAARAIPIRHLLFSCLTAPRAERFSQIFRLLHQHLYSSSMSPIRQRFGRAVSLSLHAVLFCLRSLDFSWDHQIIKHACMVIFFFTSMYRLVLLMGPSHPPPPPNIPPPYPTHTTTHVCCSTPSPCVCFISLGHNRLIWCTGSTKAITIIVIMDHLDKRLVRYVIPFLLFNLCISLILWRLNQQSFTLHVKGGQSLNWHGLARHIQTPATTQF